MGGQPRCGTCRACLAVKSRRPCLTPIEERKRQQEPPPAPPSPDVTETQEASTTGLEVRVYNAHSIQRRESDGFVNATSMASACGKLWNNYSNTQRAKDYIDALSLSLTTSITGSAAMESPTVIDCHIGGAHRGTWIHPRLAIDFARWLNPKFAVWMDGWFLESVSSGTQLPVRTSGPLPKIARVHNAPPETRGTGSVRPDLYVGVAPNLNVIKIGNTNNLKLRQGQHRTKPSREDTTTFYDKDYHHIFCSRGYGHLDQLLLEMHSERRISNSDRLRGTDIDLDAVVAALPQLQERWEAANPVTDDEHARGLKRRREESDVLLYEARNAAESARLQNEIRQAQSETEAASISVLAEADAMKAITDSLVVGNIEDAREKLKIFEQLYRNGS